MQGFHESSGKAQSLSALCGLIAAQTAARCAPAGRQLHAHVVKFGFPFVPLLANHLITFYSKCHLPHLAHQLFLSCPSPTTASWSCLIACFAQNELHFRALLAMAAMIRAGKLPNDRVIPSIAKSCAAISDSRHGRAVHSIAVKTSFEMDVFVGSSLVDMYAKLGDIVDARKVFDEMPSKNVVSWGGLIHGYAQMGMAEEALGLFKTVLSGHGGGANDFVYSCAVRVCGSATFLELGRQIHGHSLRSGFVSSSFVGSSLVSLYSKCGSPEEACRVFEEMPERNLGAWNAALMACAHHGEAGKAFSLFERMKGAGMNPNFITFLGLLSACGHAGLVDQGKEIFETMVSKHHIEPGLEHYACLVDLLSRAGKLEEAAEFIRKMPVQATESVWGALLTGSRIHGNTAMAELAATELLNSGSQSCGAHMLLASTYAAAGDFELAAQARKTMRDRGLKKETGLSWVELGNQIHAFVSGDRRHELQDQIYAKITEVTAMAEAVGYVVDTSFVGRDLDVMEKRIAIAAHSERLAVALALLLLPPERTIRVMKNLRVCGDCHTWLKCASKCTHRTVVLRDNRRFHRFDGGSCSCGDYW
ncbi:mitochondrial RNAediting factor 1 [Wolffia australiana]